MNSNITGFSYLKLSIISVFAICLEIILVLLEPIIYKQQVDFNNSTIISHWLITYLLWSLSIFFIIKHATQKMNFKIKSCGPTKILNIIVVFLLIMLSAFMSYKNWNGFKVLIEFKNLGILKFLMQYTYYLLETMLFTLIIVFAQKAFEIWFKKENIPYGGIICSLTWGLGHIITKSSLEVGLISAVLGLGFGSAYLLLNKNLILTFPVLFLMFVL